MHYLTESQVLLFLVQIFIILLLAKTGGELFRRWNQSALTAELLIGIVLGPTILGRFFPGIFAHLFPVDVVQQGMLETISWIGVLFLLLDTGLEIDFSSAWRQKGNALIIAFSGIVIPMLIAIIPFLFLSDSYLVNPNLRLPFVLFMAVVMTISDIPIASRIMHDLKILKTNIGYLTMSALAVNDIIGWGLFTIILGMFSAGLFSISNVFFVFFSTITFSVLALTLGRKFSNQVIDYFGIKKMPEPGSSFTFACLLGLFFGLITQKLGIQALFGFFLAGIIVGEAKNLKSETRTIISQMVHSLFIPIFFVNIGLKIDFIANFDWLLVLITIIIGTFGRFSGAWLGVSFSKVPKVNRNLISIAHSAGGMMGIVVALIAVKANLILPKVFIAIVCSAVFSSIVVGPWMKYALNKRKNIKILQFLQTSSSLQILAETDKFTVLEKMVANLPFLLNQQDLAKILAGEREFSTGVGECIAIPHIRLESIKDPILLFGLSHNGIDWDSPDGKLVNFVFFLFSPATENDLHVELLANIVKVIQDKGNQELILKSKNLTELSLVINKIFA